MMTKSEIEKIQTHPVSVEFAKALGPLTCQNLLTLYKAVAVVRGEQFKSRNELFLKSGMVEREMDRFYQDNDTGKLATYEQVVFLKSMESCIEYFEKMQFDIKIIPDLVREVTFHS